MFAKTLSIVLAISLLHVLTARSALAQSNLSNGPGPSEKGEALHDNDEPGAASTTSKEAKFAAKVRTAISKLGTGPDARVEVKLRNKTKLKGYIKAANDDSFVVVDDKTGNTSEVPYPQVKSVKGNNLSTGAKIAIGIAVVVLFALLLVGIAKGGP